jgi:hypothetical protein
MQIKSTMSCHFMHVRMAIMKKMKEGNVVEDTEKKELLCTFWQEAAI